MSVISVIGCKHDKNPASWSDRQINIWFENGDNIPVRKVVVKIKVE